MSFINALESVGRGTVFAWNCLGAALSALRRPRATLPLLSDILLGAMPLAVVTGLTLGVVIWIHTRGALARGSPGAEQFLPTILAVAVVLELAPIGAGLIVAARTGASLGAELGAMRQTEQIDALEMLGLSPLRELVGPRVLACVIALPLIDVFIAVLALGSGSLSEWAIGGMTWRQYESASLAELRLGDAIPATLKTLVFGFLVGVAGCWHGLRAEGGADGVGRAATHGVVLAIVLVLLADVLLVGFIRILS